LLGLRFKNTSGMPLAQGPMTVFEGSIYAGDTRVLDLQPDEERLISYAVDLGTEVSVKPGNDTARITSVKAVKGIVTTHTVVREERVYDVSNRSTTDRTLLIEQPNRKGEGFAFIGEHKPKEEAADVYRFEVPVPAKKDLSYTVTEERPVDASVHLTNNADDQIRYFLNLKEAPEGLKAKLQEAMAKKATWDRARQDIQAVTARIQSITTDQKRVRDNLRETPKESPLFQRYLKTLEEQEKEMDDLSARLKALQADEARAKAAYDEYLANLTAE
jgi:DNA repair exonuclease SbcCD nuclease subunit